MIKDFVEYIVKNLVDDKDAVVVSQRDVESKQVIEIRVASDDLGKVIGKGGTTIRSIRSIVGLVGAQRGHDVIVEVAK